MRGSNPRPIGRDETCPPGPAARELPGSWALGASCRQDLGTRCRLQPGPASSACQVDVLVSEPRAWSGWNPSPACLEARAKRGGGPGALLAYVGASAHRKPRGAGNVISQQNTRCRQDSGGGWCWSAWRDPGLIFFPSCAVSSQNLRMSWPAFCPTPCGVAFLSSGSRN